MAETFANLIRKHTHIAGLLLRETLLIFGTGLGVFLLAFASIHLVDEYSHTAAIWMPAGYILALLFLLPRPKWLFLLVASLVALFYANLLAGYSLFFSLFEGLLQCLTYALIIMFVQFVIPSGFSLNKASHLSIFFASVTSGFLISGIPVVALRPDFQNSFFLINLLERVGGNLLGAITLTPLIISGTESLKTLRSVLARSISFQNILRAGMHTMEAILLGVFIFVFTMAMFADVNSSMLGLFMRTFVLIPVLVWIYLRTNFFLVTIFYTLISLVAVLGMIVAIVEYAMPVHLISVYVIALQIYLILLGCLICAFNALYEQLRQTRLELARSEEKYRTLFENASFGIFHLTAAGRFSLANRAFAGMLGFSSVEELTNSTQALATQIGLGLPNSHVEGWVHSVHRFTNQNNKTVITKLSMRTVQPSNESEAYLEGFMENITVRMQANARLKKSEQSFRTIISTAPYAIQLFILGADGILRLEDSNPAANTLLNIEMGQAQGKTMPEVLPGFAGTSFFETCRKVASAEIAKQSFELPYLSDEVQGFYDLTAVQVSPNTMVITIVDITMRKQAEKVARARLVLLEASARLKPEELEELFIYEAKTLTGSLDGLYESVQPEYPAVHAEILWRLHVPVAHVDYPELELLAVPPADPWSESIQTQKPVICNDAQPIAGVAHKQLRRYILVPILREGRVVSVVGMANKPFAYTVPDVEAVQLLAELAWDISERKRSEEQLKNNQNLMHESELIARLGGWEYFPLNQNFHFTRGVYRIHSIPEDEPLPGMKWLEDYFLVADRRAFLDVIMLAVQDALPFDLELNALDRHGAQIGVRVRGGPVWEDGVVGRVSGSIMDISELKNTRENLARSEEQLRLALSAATDGLWDWSSAEGLIYFNPGYHSMLGYSQGELSPRPLDFLTLIHEQDRPKVKRLGRACLRGRVQNFEVELRMQHKSGQWQWVQLRGSRVAYDENGKVSRVIGTALNIDERKRAELALRQSNQRLKSTLNHNRTLQEKLLEAAVMDPLTGLFNRRYMNMTLDRAFYSARREEGKFSLILLDVDLFKRVNDTYGHRVGDEILVEISRLLEKNIRESDTACRFGGEEFVVIMPGAAAEDALSRAEAIRQAFAGQVLTSMKIHATVSIGVAEYPTHASEAIELIHYADAAMYEAKRAGRNRVLLARVS